MSNLVLCSPPLSKLCMIEHKIIRNRASNDNKFSHYVHHCMAEYDLGAEGTQIESMPVAHFEPLLKPSSLFLTQSKKLRFLPQPHRHRYSFPTNEPEFLHVAFLRIFRIFPLFSRLDNAGEMRLGGGCSTWLVASQTGLFWLLSSWQWKSSVARQRRVVGGRGDSFVILLLLKYSWKTVGFNTILNIL